MCLVGCAASKKPGDGGALDLGGSPDDFAVGDDLAVGDEDLAVRRDLAEGADLAGSDLRMPDLATPPDLAPPSDLAKPSDLSTPPDLALPPDMAMCTPPVAGGVCDTSPQCGCMSTQGCTVVDNTTGATGCVAVGATPHYSSCTSNTGQCLAGDACVDGNCQTYCNTVADCPGPYRQCQQVYSGGNPIPGFKTCSRTCDPVNPSRDDATYDPCGAGLNCFPGTAGASGCYGPVGAGTQDADCAYDSDCARGYVCGYSKTFGVNTCQHFCRTDADCTYGACTNNVYSSQLYAGPDAILSCD